MAPFADAGNVITTCEPPDRRQIDAEPAPCGTGRILLVDDDIVVRRLLTEILSELGYVVTAAESGEAAVMSFAQGHFDAVITDFTMPGMNGRVLVDRLARLGSRLPVLFISGDAPAGLVENPDSESFLQKPFTSDALALHLRDLLDRTRMSE